MTGFPARDPDYAERVRRSFAKQAFMATIGARILRVEPGEVDLVLEASAAIAQQHGFAHGGAIAGLADTACGYAALSLMSSSTGVLTVEFKINLLAPARAPRLVALGRVVRPGRSLTVAQAEVFGEDAGGDRTPVALLTATLASIAGRDGISD